MIITIKFIAFNLIDRIRLIIWILNARGDLAASTKRQHTHFLPQYDYVFDHDGNMLVDHVLRFDHLVKDFSKLTKLYPDYLKGVILSEEAEKVHHDENAGLTVDNFNEELTDLIEKTYAKDFEYFGFEKRSERDKIQ